MVHTVCLRATVKRSRTQKKFRFFLPLESSFEGLVEELFIPAWGELTGRVQKFPDERERSKSGNIKDSRSERGR